MDRRHGTRAAQPRTELEGGPACRGGRATSRTALGWWRPAPTSASPLDIDGRFDLAALRATGPVSRRSSSTVAAPVRRARTMGPFACEQRGRALARVGSNATLGHGQAASRSFACILGARTSSAVRRRIAAHARVWARCSDVLPCGASRPGHPVPQRRSATGEAADAVTGDDTPRLAARGAWGGGEGHLPALRSGRRSAVGRTDRDAPGSGRAKTSSRVSYACIDQPRHLRLALGPRSRLRVVACLGNARSARGCRFENLEPRQNVSSISQACSAPVRDACSSEEIRLNATQRLGGSLGRFYGPRRSVLNRDSARDVFASQQPRDHGLTFFVRPVSLKKKKEDSAFVDSKGGLSPPPHRHRRPGLV